MPTIGSTISIEGFDPTPSEKNILIVLMKGCRFCEGSMDFYKEVLRSALERKIKTTFVFPPKTEEAELYMEKFDLSSIPIIFAPLRDLSVDGTPTIIITDSSGKVTGFWVGQLSKEKESEVLRFVSS